MTSKRRGAIKDLHCNSISVTALCMLGIFFILLLSSSDFFQNNLFSKNPFRHSIKVSNSLDPDVSPGFKLFANVIYQQWKKVAASKGRKN